MNYLYFLSFIGCMMACSPVRYVGIETYNPSEVTFPPEIQKILIVNNAVEQPDDVGYSYQLYGVMQDTARASLDSVFYDTAYTLGKNILEGDFFEDVLLYDQPIRTDKQYLTERKLTLNQVAQLCEETGADAVLSFDRLLFSTERDIAALGGLVNGNLKIEINGTVRSYLPSREQPLATLQVVDSVYWNETAFSIEELAFYLPNTENALRIAGQYVGTKVMPYFVPHWQKETRWYYVGQGARWKDATAFVNANKWKEAYKVWTSIYDSSSSWSERAKAASNLALYFEMETDLNNAYSWALRSYELFNKHKGESDKYTKIEKLYVEALAERIHAEKKLKMQFGE